MTLQPYAFNFFKIITTRSTECPNQMIRKKVIIPEDDESIKINLKDDSKFTISKDLT